MVVVVPCSFGLVGCSSRSAERKVENGVFSSRKGLVSRCLVIRLRRDEGRGGATVVIEERGEGQRQRNRRRAARLPVSGIGMSE